MTLNVIFLFFSSWNPSDKRLLSLWCVFPLCRPKSQLSIIQSANSTTAETTAIKRCCLFGSGLWPACKSLCKEEVDCETKEEHCEKGMMLVLESDVVLIIKWIFLVRLIWSTITVLFFFFFLKKENYEGSNAKTVGNSVTIIIGSLN